MASIRAIRERMEANASEARLSGDSIDPVNPVWPLGGNGNNFIQPQNRGAPPQRPPRPNYVPPLLVDSQRQEPTVAYNQIQESNRNPIQQQQARYWEPNYMMSGPLTPATPSSRDSAGSSVGSIPDFPVPALPAQTPQPIPRRSTNVGPPPTQRRGPSSYYSHASFVAPIPEEGVETSHQPHTARRAQAVPDDWQDDESDFFIDRDSTISAPGEHLVEPIGLVRNASMGRQYKPSLKTIRPASQTLQQQKGHAAPQLTVVDRSHLAAEHTVCFESVDSDDEQASLHDEDNMEGTAFLQTPYTDVDMQREAILREKEIIVLPSNPRALKLAQQNSRIQNSRAGAEKDHNRSLMQELTPNGQVKPAAFDFREETLNRASMTSLTDLLRRATRVRTNLEKGRTASRLGLRDFLNTSKSDLLKSAKNDPARESLTDMLESFPPPAAVTPPRQSPTRDPPLQTTQANGRWPSPFTNTSGNPALSSKEQNQYAQQSNSRERKRRNPQGRRCCGLPLWGFILCVVLLIVLTAAAILIPVFLIVIPNENKASASCAMSSPCSNNGYSITSSTGCQCICAGGFTGSQCTQTAPVTSDCATAPFGPYQQVTIGTKVLPLLTGASQFSIPLNNTILLADFSSTRLYCGDENNLVTFVNVKTSSSQKRDLRSPMATLASPVRRDNTVTSAGLVLDQPTTTAISSAPTATATPPSASQLGFAQTAILYIFQQTSIASAQGMRQALDTAFSNGAWLGPITNSNATVDLRLFKVTAGGTTVGSGA